MAISWWPKDRSYGADSHTRVTLPARAVGGTVHYLSEETCDAGAGDVVVFRHTISNYGLEPMTEAQARGATVLVDLDDRLLGEDVVRDTVICALPLPAQWLRVASAEEACRVILRGLLKAIRTADGLIVSTPALADFYADYNPNVQVGPAMVDPNDWPTPQPRTDDEFVVGFAGSNSHVDDLWLTLDALKWAAEQPGVRVEVFGFDPAGVTPTALERRMWDLMQSVPHDDEMQVYQARAQCHRILDAHPAAWDFPYTVTPWVETTAEYFATFAGRFDIGLCPIDPQSRHGAWRTDLKPLEFAMAGALPIVSRVPAYADWEDRVPTPTTPADWLAAVQWAVANRDEVREQAAAVREHVLDERTVTASTPAWQAATSAVATAVAQLAGNPA